MRTSLRGKIFAAVLVASFLPFLAAVWLLARASEADLRTAALAEARSAGALAQALAQERATRLLAVAQAIALTPGLGEALAARDRPRILALTQPWLPRLGTTTVALTDERGVMVLRTYAPDRFGDDVAATTKGLLPALRGEPGFSTEAAGLRGLAIRGFGPVLLDGRVVGVAAVTQNLDQEFLAGLHAAGGFETFAVLPDGSTVGDAPGAATVAQVARGGEQTTLVPVGDSWRALHTWPLLDPERATVGYLGIVFPLDALARAQQRVRLTATGAGAAAVAASVLLAWLLSLAAVAPVERISRAARRIAQGVPATISVVRSGDELEELSASLGSMVATLTDQAHRLEEQNARVRESEERYRAVVEQSADAIVVVEGTTAVYANDAYARLLALPGPEQAVGRTGDAWLHPDDRDLVTQRTLARQRGEPVPPVYEFRIVRTTGEIRTVEVAATPITRGGRPATLAVLRDVTERKRAEAAQRLLTEASAILGASLDYEATLATVTQLLVPGIADWCTVYLRRDGELERVAGAHADPEKGELLRQLARRYPRRADRPDPVLRVVETGEPLLAPVVTPEGLAQHAHDAEHARLLAALDPRSAIIVPLVARGEALGALGLNRTGASPSYQRDDLALALQLADRCAAAIDNARLYDQARDALRAQDQFLAIAAHELRTPLAALKGNAQLLQRAHRRGTLDPQRTEQWLDALLASANRLQVLTNDLLDVGRLRTGRLTLRRETVDLVPLVRGLTARFEGAVDGRHRLIVDSPESPAPCGVYVDTGRIEQVLTNLLDNAIKYSPAGGDVHVSVRPESGGVAVAVADQGMGLPPGAADHIFEPFGRAANATAASVPGMGLGLYVCRGIVEQHGGHIRAESPGEGKGTTVTVWLPSAPA